MRYFIIPMQRPANPTGKGTITDPWRPKYLRELGLGWTGGTNFRHFMLTGVTGDNAQIDVLAASAGVFEITGQPLKNAQKNVVRNWLAKRGVTDANMNLTGQALIDELFRVARIIQLNETPQERAAIFAELTAV